MLNERLRRRAAAALASWTLLIAGPALAHHSFAMFDREHKIELVGTVKEFQYTSPHLGIVFEVKRPNGETAVWTLIGLAPSLLVRDGWSRKTLKPGDKLKMRVAPLRSGAPGGFWVPEDVSYADGKPIVSDE